MAPATSFIRWAGGKSWLVPFVQNLTSELDFNNYYEPFMGGASVFFALDTPHHCVLSDMNSELVNTFCAVRDNPERIISYLSDYKTDESSYYQIRGSEPRGKYQKAARFLYLNTYSYNGLYRVNRQGKYNVPYGHREKAKIDYDRVLIASQKLASVQILCQDFDASRETIQAGDLVFLDPPYTVPKDAPNVFIEYNQTLFSLDDQYRLGALIGLINERNAFYIMTNAAHEKITEIFGKLGRQIVLERNSLIGGKEAFRGKVEEYIFTNIPKRVER